MTSLELQLRHLAAVLRETDPSAVTATDCVLFLELLELLANLLRERANHDDSSSAQP